MAGDKTTITVEKSVVEKILRIGGRWAYEDGRTRTRAEVVEALADRELERIEKEMNR